MSSTLRVVHSGREASFSSLRRATWTARSVGTQVNRETTSKEIMVSGVESDYMPFILAFYIHLS